MIAIKKITVKYSVDEDRLFFAVETSKDDSLILWMTMRLAVRVVAGLISKLDEEKPLSEDKPESDKQESFEKKQALQEWEQSAASLTRKSASEVKVKPAAKQLLVNSLDIGHTLKGFAIVFRWGKNTGAQAAFTPMELRQFLQILYINFKQAGWPMDIWPDSYAQKTVDKNKPQPMFLH